jgi:hypothetical protein
MSVITAADINILLSVPTAGSGFSAAGIPGNSLGKYCSTTIVSSSPYDNLWTDITGPENSASQVDYQCVFILNNTATGNSMVNTMVWIPVQNIVPGGATQTLATDNIGVVIKTSGSPQATVIASNLAAPVGVSGYVPPSSTSAGGIPVGTVPPGFVFAVWVQRTATNSPPVNGDGYNLQVDFDTNG